MTRRIGYIFGALAHSLYTRNSLDPKYTDAWKYYYHYYYYHYYYYYYYYCYYYLRFKQTSTKNTGPGSLLMQVLQKKSV